MGMNILIVDDSRLMRSAISHSLDMTDLTIDNRYEAPNGRQALEIMESQAVDLIFLDIFMPEMNGLEFVDAVKEDIRFREIPIVVISSDGCFAHIERLRNQGVNAFIRKPFTPEHIQETLEGLLEMHHGF